MSDEAGASMTGGVGGPTPGDVRRAVEAARSALAESARAMTVAGRRWEQLSPALDVLLGTGGRVVVTGLGKSGLVGAKLAATLASTGSPAFFVHASDALHGDAGMVTDADVLLAISNSGETAEVCRFATMVRERGARVVAMTGCGGGSGLARLADALVDVSVEREADPYDLVPTTSTEVTAAVGDALAVALMVARGFGPDDFHAHHPGGAIGSRLGVPDIRRRAVEATDPPERRSAEVCVLGSFMMDLSVRAPRRPEAGETIMGTEFATYLGGKGFNQAVAAARQGASTAMIGRLGDDEFGGRFRSCLVAEGIDLSYVAVDTAEGTGVGLPLVEDSGENSIAVVPRANHRITVDDVWAAESAIVAARVLLVQLELPTEVVTAACRIARDAGVLVVVNPAPAVLGLPELRGIADVIVPNEQEAAVLWSAGVGSPAAVAGALAATTGADVVLTLGSRGCVVLEDGLLSTMPAHPVAVVDTVGAGDAFCGTLGARLASGASLAEAAVHANAAAALCVTARGAEQSIPTGEQVAELLGSAPTRDLLPTV